MSLRQVAGSLLRRLRYPSQTVSATSFGRTTNYLPNHVLFLGMNASPVYAEDVSIELSSEDDVTGANITGLRKIEDGSVVSNLHTSKWRVFTDYGRDLFLQGKLEEAERLFLSALQEAKKGFGERDPHVASACNNLAELYRVKKAFNKAEPLYLEAINILEESFGSDDIRVGAALHNLGQFYLVQRKLEEARVCYERALKIKRRVLGEGHADYADTMYHLGRVLYFQGKEKDSEVLIQDSIRILEEGGQGESIIFLKRLRYLAQIYIKSNRLADAENVQRKILHMMELSKGWNSLDTIISAEGLALILQSVGSLKEAQELLERCLDGRKKLLFEDHIQIAANMLHIARVEMLTSNQLRMTSISDAIAELDKAKDLLGNAIRISRTVLDKLKKQKGNQQFCGVSKESRKDGHTALLILLQSLYALGMLEITKVELQESRDYTLVTDPENALHHCISAFKEVQVCVEDSIEETTFALFDKEAEKNNPAPHAQLLNLEDKLKPFGTERSLSNSPEVKAEYLSCLRLLSGLLSNRATDSMQQSKRATLQEVENEIKRVEGEQELGNSVGSTQQSRKSHFTKS